MARYKDADKIVFWIRYVSSNGMLCDTDVRKVAFSDEIARMPTADVAPRAEIAREIFEEIRNILNKHYYALCHNKDGDECDAVTSYLSYVAVDFDGLEQKYTGAEPEPPKGEKHDPDPA